MANTSLSNNNWCGLSWINCWAFITYTLLQSRAKSNRTHRIPILHKICTQSISTKYSFFNPKCLYDENSSFKFHFTSLSAIDFFNRRVYGLLFCTLYLLNINYFFCTYFIYSFLRKIFFDNKCSDYYYRLQVNLRLFYLLRW
jgi:hypothetical protein